MGHDSVAANEIHPPGCGDSFDGRFVTARSRCRGCCISHPSMGSSHNASNNFFHAGRTPELSMQLETLHGKCVARLH
eukprot:6180614-Pleurochrysis_carterae.AAC.3